MFFLFLYKKGFRLKYDLFSWVSSLQGFLCPRKDGAMQSPCSYFLFICLICLKQQTVRMKKSKFLRGSFWVCTDVLPTKHQSDIIDFLFFPLPIIHHSFPPSLTWTEPYTHLILSLIHSSALTLKFHLHVSKTLICV